VKSLLNNILFLLVFGLLVLFAGRIILVSAGLDKIFPDFLILTLVFTSVTLISLYIFIRGQSRESHNQTMHTLVSISLKFLLELGLTIFWFIVAKKTFTGSVIMFFVLYLTFSLFLILIILKTLKKRSL